MYRGSANAIGGIIRTSKIQKSMAPFILYLNLALDKIYEQASPNTSENASDIIVICKLLLIATKKLFRSKSLIKCFTVNDPGKKDRDLISSASSLIDKDIIQ
jgi:hypothetical protein